MFADVANNVTVANISVQVTESTNNNYPERSSLFFSKAITNSANTFSNVTVDASGLAITNVLHQNVNANETYENVVIKAASYTTIGYSDSGKTALAAFPAGVTFEEKTSQIKYHLNNSSNTEVLPYIGDETALGFNEGTIVYAIEQDNRTSMWNPGTNLGLTMERQALKIYKAADEDYASVQFSVSRDVPGTHAFFAWIGFADNSGVAGGYLYNNGTPVPSVADSGFNGAYYDAEGNQVTSGLKANTVYTVKWYYPNATVFKIGCAVADGSPITLYFANMSSGNDA